MVTLKRKNILTHSQNVSLLHQTFQKVRRRHPFKIDAIVLLPDHLHCIWTLPDNDRDFSTRWRLIKSHFTRKCDLQFKLKPFESRKNKKEQALWQRRFWEHLIRDDEDKPVAFQNIARDVTEERRLRDNLRLQIHKTLMAQEEERKRIARELHDDVAQSILLLSRQLDILISGNGHKIPKDSIGELEHIQNIANETYKSLQRYARDLRPSILDQMGLVAALNWLSEELSKDLGIKTTVKADKLPPLPPEIELAMFRIAQEALNNVRKHAQASEANIKVKLEPDSVKMTITDNGKGFLAPRLTGDLAREGKLGVLGMEERARLIGGDLQIKSRPDKGTTVHARAPI